MGQLKKTVGIPTQLVINNYPRTRSYGHCCLCRLDMNACRREQQGQIKDVLQTVNQFTYSHRE